MKYKPIIITIILCVLGAIGILLQRNCFRQKYAISQNLELLQTNGDIQCLDMETGKIQTFSPEEYSSMENTCLMIVQNGAEQTEVFSYEDGVQRLLFLTQQYIWQQPVMVDQCIYFIAAETNEERSGLLLNDAYIWIYQDGIIQKLSSMPVHPYSGIQKAGRFLLYVEKGASDSSDAQTKIIQYDTKTGETERLCAGQYPCWKEEEVSFFFGSPDGNICVFNISLKSIETLCKSLELRKTPIYNAIDQVLLLCYTDISVPKSVDITTDGLFYLQKCELLSYRTYFQKMFWKWGGKYSCKNAVAWISKN